MHPTEIMCAVLASCQEKNVFGKVFRPPCLCLRNGGSKILRQWRDDYETFLVQSGPGGLELSLG